jgi:hypothetical protein
MILDSSRDPPGPIHLELLAGSLGGPGAAEGPGLAAAVHVPQSVAVATWL